jgi:hypothetical protein
MSANHEKTSVLDQIMGTEEAAQLWGLRPSYVKDLCRNGTVKAVNIGRTWIIDRNQPNPKRK